MWRIRSPRYTPARASEATPTVSRILTIDPGFDALAAGLVALIGVAAKEDLAALRRGKHRPVGFVTAQGDFIELELAAVLHRGIGLHRAGLDDVEGLEGVGFPE